MTFGSTKFCYDTEDIHSKRERLEIIVLHLKPVLFDVSCEIRWQFFKYVKFSGKMSSYKIPLSLKNVKESEICPCVKFRFNYIFVVRNIANKHFSLKKKPLTKALNTLSTISS